MADRYSNWLSVLVLPQDDSQHLIQALREYSTYFGIPRLLSSDGASIFTSAETEEFCKRWGIEQRISSSYHPVSNKRAELAVKSSKRLVRDNMNEDGSLNCDKFSRAILLHRNNPDPVTGVSPAQILYGRQLRDHLPTPPHKFALQSNWEKAAKLREDCFIKRHYAKCEDLSTKTKPLPILAPGDLVYVQDQAGKTPRQWNKSGKVLEALTHDSYLIRIDGSYRTTKRNRRFLRKFTPHNLIPSTSAEPEIAPSTETILPNTVLRPDYHQIRAEQDTPLWPQPVENSTPPPDTLDTSPPTPNSYINHQQEQSNQQQLPEKLKESQPITQLGSPTSTKENPSYNSPNQRSCPPMMQHLPKHLREKWVLSQAPITQTNDPQQSNMSPIHYMTPTHYHNTTHPTVYPPTHGTTQQYGHQTHNTREQQIAAAAKNYMHACLEVFQFNLSEASMGGGNITRT